MFSLILRKNTYIIFLNKKIFFRQKLFYLKSLCIIKNKKHTWFLKIQKDLYHFGLRSPFSK